MNAADELAAESVAPQQERGVMNDLAEGLPARLLELLSQMSLAELRLMLMFTEWLARERGQGS